MTGVGRQSFIKSIRLLLGAVLAALILQTNWASALSLPSRISFQNVLENKDITMGEGASFFQDSEGYMWLGGSTALIRYDGYEFRQMDFVRDPAKPKDRESIRYTGGIYEDHAHNLWIASRSGLLKYIPALDQMTLIPDDDSQPQKLVGASVSRVIELSDGQIIVATFGGLFTLDSNTNKYKLIKPGRVNAMLPEGKEYLWLGTEFGLEKYNWVTGEATPIKLAEDLIGAVTDPRVKNMVRDVVRDQEGAIWLATAAGIVRFDPKTQESTRIQNNLADPTSLGSNDVWRLLIDSQGVLWAATDGGGLCVYDREKKRFINHKLEPGRIGSLNSNAVRSVFEDKNHDIWVGNYPVGVFFFDRSSAPISSYSSDPANVNSLAHNSVLSVQEDKDGNLWMGTGGGGLDFFNRETEEFKHFKSDPKDPNTLNGNAVTVTYVDSQGLIWTGAWGAGIASYDPVTQKFTRYPIDLTAPKQRTTISDGLNSSQVWFITEDTKHNLWIATHTGGISRLDRNTKQFTHYNFVDGDPNSINSKMVWTIYEDSKGNFWVGANNGLNLMDREKETFTNFVSDAKDPTTISNSSAVTLLEDRKGRLWVGTDAGLNLYHPESKTFTRFTKNDGFLNDHVRKILEDSEGNLWVSTDNGFSMFNPDTKKIKNYNRVGGRLIGGFFSKSGLLSRKREIIFGGSEGLRIFDPRALTENTERPPVVLTDFKIFSDSVVVGGADGILKKSINFTDRIVLDHTKSMFVFGFSALNYRDSAKNQYSYKLDGFDDDWMKPGTQRSAKYTNLDPGTYVFRVKGSNNDGVWNLEGKSITIIQLPPPWRTWWAYTLYTLMALSLIAAFIRQQRKKRELIEEQNRVLEIRVSERTAEVRAKSKDIQAMLSNMPQGLFTVQEDGLIHPEYSIYLESIFETKNIALRNVSEFLFGQARLGADELASVNAAIFAIVGEDEINFEFNRPLLIKEYEYQVGDGIKYLALDWNPIVENEMVNKLMISVRDITQVKVMESAALEQKRKLDIVSQLLDVAADKYLNFEESSKKYINACREAITTVSDWDEQVIALLFRNMHTIKGNSRTFGFTYLSNAAHEIESVYAELKQSPDRNWQPDALIFDLESFEGAVAEYSHVYHTVLGREGNSNQDRSDGFWMNNSVLEKIQTYVETEDLSALKIYLNQISSKTIEEDLGDIVSALNSVAAQLDKNPPVVTIAPNDIRIKSKAQGLLKDVFSHILRNSIDHGLESTEERELAGKDSHGLITIRPSVHNGELNIFVHDDGRGIHLAGLFNKGVELGKWQADEKPTSMEIADLIFYSGVTTKNTVTDISGRGVGMNAVSQFLKEGGGRVAIELYPDQSVRPDYVPFSLIVTLPNELFFVDGEDNKARL